MRKFGMSKWEKAFFVAVTLLGIVGALATINILLWFAVLLWR